MRFIEDHRDHIIEILRDVKTRFPLANDFELEALARNEIARLQPKSRAFYRIVANHNLIGSSLELIRYNESVNAEDPFSGKDSDKLSDNILHQNLKKSMVMNIYFDPKEYTVMEDCGHVQLTVTRDGMIEGAIVVHYRTEDGNAKAVTDYEEKQGVITFGPGEAHKQINIKIINDDEFEEDEYFFVKLYDAQLTSVAVDSDIKPEIRITCDTAKINILDDDHSGIFSFTNNVFQIPETIGQYNLVVNRYCGARGQVHVPFETVAGTAIPGEDFQMKSGEIVFNNNETHKSIELEIINNIRYEKNSIFYVLLRDPYRKDSDGKVVPSSEPGAPKLGDLVKCMIRIRESNDFKKIVDNLMRRKKTVNDVGGSWENQLINAVRVQKLGNSLSMDDIESSGSPSKGERREGDLSGDGDKEADQESDEPKTVCDYICHYLTLFWKLVFAFVPPPSIGNGWACFVVSITVIGILTALINDLASHFGSTVHLKDSITAISLVALGTSVPDTFASKIAAQNEKNADSSIGNVTGSNAVNVFLGIGIAWMVAAVYHAIKGTPGGFQVEPGSLAYSVSLFCICAFICSVVLMVRRVYLGGELGGPLSYKILTVGIFVSLWIFYLVMSTLEAYGYID